jgi:hypothetical protein
MKPTTLTLAFAATVFAASLRAPTSRPVPAPGLFESRADYAPLVEKLRASRGDPSRILHPKTPRGLTKLGNGVRYKFVLLQDGSLAIAPLPAEAADNEYVHPILAGGLAVLTAGGIRVDHDGQRIRRVTLDENSQAYCPTFRSLETARRALARLGVDPGVVRLKDTSPDCLPAKSR